MTITEFRNAYATQPFQPFTLYLADGRKMAVQHSELVAISPGGRTVIVYQPDDSYDVIDLLLVTSLKVEPRKTARRKRQGG